ncbi:YihY/virulence factor BrkB family protein [Sphingomonas echinoides]|uniref:YihY/virulence factor BrkB family protein n=2 Tax=Pseudomonadota TaxID=1224 RepID=A0ABU4PPN8_9SPHN|nr:YihY/virulence factor BrkB family protein [Sphingomonas echinoides]MDX5986106.1 YihY/virulence factor BrkB family protein [Sphingomonas echinoides]
MSHISPVSPEEREAHRAAGGNAVPVGRTYLERLARRAWQVLQRVLIGVFSDGFIHAGNLAYLALLTVFPFFILAAAIASLIGQSAETQRAVASFLHVLPPNVSELLAKPIADVLVARTGSLLWLGAIVGLWSVGSFVETIRDIFRRAYGVKMSRPFWHYRLSSMLVIIVSVVVALLSFLVQGVLTAAERFIYDVLPVARDVAGWVGLSRAVPGVVMFIALYMLFFSVTPAKYRLSKCPKWPGALFTSAWWVTITALLPVILSRLSSYSLTYGSLAGVIVALLFFFLVGLGIVVGAHLNAALAEPPEPGVESAHGIKEFIPA